MLKMLKQTSAFRLVITGIDIVIHNIKSHYFSVQFLIAHEYSHGEKAVGIFRIFDRQQHFLVIIAYRKFLGNVLVLKANRLRCMFRHDA